MARQAVAICYDLPVISRFFRSVARAVVLARTTKVEWVRYRDSAVINAIYTVLCWMEPPGNAEIKEASPARFEADINKLHEQYLSAWLKKVCVEGPWAANIYVGQMEKLRHESREDLMILYRDVGQINRDIVETTKDAVRSLATIKLTSAVGVAVISGGVGLQFAAAAMGGSAAGGVSLFGLSAGASSTTFGGVGFGTSLINSVVKNWEQAPTATVAAINTDTLKDTAKYVASDAGGKFAEHAFKEAARNAAHAKQIISSADGIIRQHSERLAQETLRKAAQRKSRNMMARAGAQIVQQTARQGAAQNAMRVARATGSGLPVVFAAADVIDAWADYQATVGP